MRKRSSMLLVALLIAVAVGACGGSSGGSPAPTQPTLPQPAPPPAPNPDANLEGRIVYTLRGDLHVYTVATRSDVDLRVRGINPKFSADGTMIVFQSGGVSVMKADGSGQSTLSASGGVPAFDPAGKTVAFGDRSSGIWKINVDGTGLTQLTSDGGFQPAWSPDGSRIAYSVTVAGIGQQLFLVRADGTDRQRALTSKPIVDVVWRPSGKILSGLLVNDNPFDYELYSYDPDDAASLTRLTTRLGNDFEPSWSTDGKNISWSRVSDGLWIMNADGTAPHFVIPDGRQGSWGK